MLIVGDNLSQLVAQHDMCNPALFDETSLQMSLMRVVFEPRHCDEVITYERHDYTDLFSRKSVPASGLMLNPGDAILACSNDVYFMPMGYFGQVQTKGSLARLFVSTHMNDPQVDPGFKGRITFEIVNSGPFKVTLPIAANVAQLYVWKCSTTNNRPYGGRYNNATEPTVPRLPA